MLKGPGIKGGCSRGQVGLLLMESILVTDITAQIVVGWLVSSRALIMVVFGRGEIIPFLFLIFGETARRLTGGCGVTRGRG